MADIDKKYASIVKSDEFKNWVQQFKKKMSNLDVDSISTRVLLFYYLFHRDVHGDSEHVNIFFTQPVRKGYYDILNGKHITLQMYTIKPHDYFALLRNTLETINIADYEESIEDLSKILPRLPNVHTVYMIDGLQNGLKVNYDELDRSNPETVDVSDITDDWPESVQVLRIKMPGEWSDE